MDTTHQLLRFFQKIAEKYPATEAPEVFTDIHVRVSQDTGDVRAYDDDDRELTRVVVEQWAAPSSEPEAFAADVEHTLQALAPDHCAQLGIIRPYNIVLETETGEHLAEIAVFDDDDDTILLGTPFLTDLDSDLQQFITQLMDK